MALTRSQQMARIKARDTEPERLLRSALWSRGHRYRLHAETHVGKPDVVFPGRRVAVFIDGCFWHGCPDHYVRPTTNCPFWAAKLVENVQRDHNQTLELEARGWLVVRVWEHSIYEEMESVVELVELALSGETDKSVLAWRVIRVDPEGEQDGRRTERRIVVELRDPSRQGSSSGPRITRKWRRPPMNGR